MRLIILSVLCVVIFSMELDAQCFSSTGNPIGGNANMGAVNKNMLRVSAFYKHSYSGKYFYGDALAGDKGHVTAKDAVYNYTNMFLGYGITNKLTLEASTGYYINKTKNFPTEPVTGFGLSNAVLATKYNFFYDPVSRWEITGRLGGKFPLSTKEQKIYKSGSTVPEHPDVQPSLGNFGFNSTLYVIKEDAFRALRFFLISKYEHNFWSIDGYFENRQFNFGNALNTSVFVSKHIHMPPALSWLTENWTAILQVRHEHKWQNQKRPDNFLGYDDANEEIWEYGDWETVKNSGSDVVFIVPQINYTFVKKWNLSVMVDIPLYQYYQGIQLASDYAFSVNLTRDFDFNN